MSPALACGFLTTGSPRHSHRAPSSKSVSLSSFPGAWASNEGDLETPEAVLSRCIVTFGLTRA